MVDVEVLVTKRSETDAQPKDAISAFYTRSGVGYILDSSPDVVREFGAPIVYFGKYRPASTDTELAFTGILTPLKRTENPKISVDFAYLLDGDWRSAGNDASLEYIYPEDAAGKKENYPLSSILSEKESDLIVSDNGMKTLGTIYGEVKRYLRRGSSVG